MARVLVTFFICLVCCASLVAQHSHGRIFMRETSSTYVGNTNQQGYDRYQIRNKYFQFARTYPNGGIRILLLEIENEIHEHPYMEGGRYTTRVTARADLESYFDTVLWEIEDHGRDVETGNGILTLITPGCCELEDTYIYYDLLTGTKLLL